MEQVFQTGTACGDSQYPLYPGSAGNPVLDQAKTLIKEFCAKEYGSDSEVDFSDLRHVGIAFTETEDGRTVQVEVDLVGPSIRTYVAGELRTEEKYRSISELIVKELMFLEFDALVCVD